MPEQTFFGNTPGTWLTAAALTLVSWAALSAVKVVIRRQLAAFVSKTKTNVDDVLVGVFGSTRFWFLLVVSLFIGASTLTFPDSARAVLHAILVGALILQGALWVNTAIIRWAELLTRHAGDGTETHPVTWGAAKLAAQVALWLLASVLLLENLGVNITGLVAGLGIGGIAVALALQNILSDLFSSFSIMLDKPFVVGDFIVVDEHLGGVEKIGLKTTRIRSLSGEVIVFSNADLLKSRVKNYRHMAERRVAFSVGVTYQTSHDTLRTISTMLADIIRKQPKVRIDRVHFKEFGDSALIFEAVYYVTDPGFNTYMDIQQAINLEIYRRFSEAGIEFAYPTRTLYVQPSSGNGDHRQSAAGISSQGNL